MNLKWIKYFVVVLFIFGGTGFYSNSIYAENEMVFITDLQQDPYTKIEQSQLPDKIKNTLNKDYANSKIDEVYVNGDKSRYRMELQVTNAQGQMERKTVYYSKEGKEVENLKDRGESESKDWNERHDESKKRRQK